MMRNQRRKQIDAVVLSGFGAALALMAGNLALAEETKSPPSTKAVAPTRQAVPVKAPSKPNVQPDLCALKDEQCVMAKPFATQLNVAQTKELKVMIAKGIRVDIKDACLVC
jgi:hypothetical protein